jgi:exodeoxyribonuclease VII large subunit
MMKDKSQEVPLSVSELVSSIKLQLENDFSELFVEGEISNLTQSSTGHWYFNISDQESSISCCLFRNQTLALNEIKKIKDGDKIKIIGHISVYAKRTAIQVIAKKIIAADIEGDLKKKFELLKVKLAQEGYFDLSRKKKNS